MADAGGAEDDENSLNSLDRQGSYNAAKDIVDTKAEEPRGESKEALELKRGLWV